MCLSRFTPGCCGSPLYRMSAQPGTISSLTRRKVRAVDNWDGVGNDKIYHSPVGGGFYTAFCFDRKNLNHYATTFNTRQIRRMGEDSVGLSNGGTSTLVATAPPLGVQPPFLQCIDCDPTNERLFYRMLDINIGASTTQLRKVNYDGTGDTLLKSLTNFFGISVIEDILYAKDLDRVYYFEHISTPFGSARLRYISPDGTGDTIAVTGTAAHEMGGGLAHDIANEYIFWCETFNSFVGNAEIYRADMDGGGKTLIYSSTGQISGMYCKYSQLLEKLFVFDVDADEVVMMDNDGSNQESVSTISVDFPEYFGSNLPMRFALGNKLETVGPSAIL